MAPKDSGTPGKGKHGVPDKQAHKVGRKWEKDRPDPQKTPGHEKDTT